MADGKLAITKASSRMLSNERFGFELFTIRPELKCKPYRYTWGTSLQVRTARDSISISWHTIMTAGNRMSAAVLRLL